MSLMKRKLKLEKNNRYCKNPICKYRAKDLRSRVMVYLLKKFSTSEACSCRRIPVSECKIQFRVQVILYSLMFPQHAL